MGSCISACYLNRKCIKDEDSIMAISKRNRFYTKYYQQNFSMPDSIIFYVAKNPKTAILYLKMVKTCQYFFVKNQIIIIPYLFSNGEWRIRRLPFNLTKYNCKYWITDKIYVTADKFLDKNIFSPIIPKFYRCDVKCLSLSDLSISFDVLSLIISSAEWIRFKNVIVKHADSSVVPIEDIIAIAVNAKSVSVDKPTITPKTMKELTKLPNFTKLRILDLYNLSEVSDIDAFFSYMKNRLETIVDEILETKEFHYEPPLIKFYGVDIEKFEKLCQIYDFH